MSLLTFAALLFVLSFPNFIFTSGFSPAAFVFLVPVFFGLNDSVIKRKALFGFVWGLISYALLVVWLYKVHSLGYILFLSMLAVQPLFFASRLRKPRSPVDFLFIPSLWVASEMIRTYLLGGFAWTIGHSQAFSGWGAGWTIWGGSYAVSFGIVLANTLLFKAFTEKRSRILFLFMFFTVISAGYLSGRQKPYQTQNKSLRICSVQPSISPNEKIDPLNLIPSLEKHLALSETCFDSKPDLIVWPETAVTDDVVNELGLNAVITGFVKEKNVPIVVGSAMLIDGKDKNSAVFFSPVDDVQVYHKQSLIPFMEKCPFRSGTLKKAFCENDFEAARTAGMFVLKGEPSYPFGTAICSEDNHPNIFRDLKSRGALLTLVVFNDARLNSIPAYKMHLQNSVMQSMAFRMPILRVGNSGITAYIDEFGRITTRNNSLGIDDVFAYSFNVHPHTGSTFYAKYGDFFAWSCLIFVIIFELIKIVFRRKQGYEKIST